MFQNNMQMQLPFPCDTLQRQLINIHPSQFGFIQYNGPDWLRAMAPNAGFAVAMNIQQNAQMNPLRVFMFNQCSENNFNNTCMYEIVSRLLDLVNLHVSRNQNVGNIEGVLTQLADQLVTGFCAYNTQLFPALFQFINQSIVPAVQADAFKLTELIQGMSGGFSGNSMAIQNPQYQHNVGRVGMSNVGVTQNNQYPVNNSNIRSAGNSIFNGMNNVNQNQIADKFDAKFSVISQNTRENDNVKVTMSNTNSIPVKEEIQVHVSAPKLLKPSEIKWKPSEGQQYFIAYDPANQSSVIETNQDNVIKRQHINSLDEPVMDYDRHKLKTAFGSPMKQMVSTDVYTVKSNISSNISMTSNKPIIETKEIEEKAEKEKIDIEKFVNSAVLADSCLNQAWTTLQIDRLLYSTPASLYRGFTRISTPIISDVDESDLITKFQEQDTFIQVLRLFEEIVSKTKPTVWSIINKRLTKAVNRMIFQNLSITTVSIDSFYEDYESLIDCLTNKFGNTILNAFLSHQKDIIKSIFKDVYEDLKVDMVDMVFDGKTFDDSTKPEVSFICTDYSINYIDMTSFDLSIDLNKSGPSVVSKEYTPFFYDIVESIMTLTRPDGFTIHDRTLLRTNDNRVLELTIGYIGGGYLVTIVE